MAVAQKDSKPDDRRSTVYRYVAERAGRLYEGKLEDRAGAVADLARLRSGATREIGSDPAVWRAAFTGYPEVADDTTFPSHAEFAVYVSLSLYAYHQQGQRSSMHTEGPSFGTALRKLAYVGTETTPKESVVRRFNALVTADTFDETRSHLRSLVGQLRAEGIPLDYGRLADDLERLHSPWRNGVQLRWSRDFSRTPRTEGPSSDADE